MTIPTPSGPQDQSFPLHSELLLLPDGRVFVHNLTPEFADLLQAMGMCELRGIVTAMSPTAPSIILPFQDPATLTPHPT